MYVALLWRYRGLFATTLGLMMINRATALALPLASKFFVDDVTGAGSIVGVPLLIFAVLLGLAIESASGFALSRVSAIGAQRVITDIRSSLAAHVMQLPVHFFEHTSTGAVISRIMADPEGMRTFLGTGLIQIVGATLSTVLSLIILGRLRWVLAAAVATVFVMYAVTLTGAFRRLFLAFQRATDATARLTSRLAEAVGGIRVVKACGAETREASAVAAESARLLTHVSEVASLGASLMCRGTIFAGLATLLVLVVGGRAVLGHQMTVGDLTMALFLTGLMSTPIVEAAAHVTEIGRSTAGLARIREIHALLTEDDEDRLRATRPIHRVVGHVAFDHVSFWYTPHRYAIHDLCFSADVGSTTALVGPSGAGKSTIYRLLLGWSWPTEGRVLIDGTDLATLGRRDYRRLVGIVPQEGFLFDGTIADNIRLGRPDASIGEVIAAATAAQCSDFVSSLRNGYDTMVGERGVRLSGGQRQRIAIARALLGNPAILLLDEATASLDGENEMLVQQALDTLASGRTTFVITHRLSTVRRADQIIVLDRGHITQRGTHDDLIAAAGWYQRFYLTQNGAARHGTPTLSHARVL